MKKCEDCGATYETVMKYNSGNPREFQLPTCDCLAEKNLEAFLARLDAS